MNNDSIILRRLTQAAFAVMFLASLVGVFFWYLPVIKINSGLRQDIYQLNQEIQRELQTAGHLKSSINAFQNDPLTIEREARQKRGYARPGETIIKFVPPPTNSAPIQR